MQKNIEKYDFSLIVPQLTNHGKYIIINSTRLILCERAKPLITQKAKLNKKIDLVGEILQGLFLRLSTL